MLKDGRGESPWGIFALIELRRFSENHRLFLNLIVKKVNFDQREKKKGVFV